MSNQQEQTQVQTAERDARGRFLKPPPGNRAFTSDNAAQMVAKRVAKYRQASARGLVRAMMAIDPEVQTPGDAYATLTERAVVDFMDKPRSDMFEEISKAIGARPLAHEIKQTGGEQVINNLVILADDAARAIVDALTRIRGAEGVIDIRMGKQGDDG